MFTWSKRTSEHDASNPTVRNDPHRNKLVSGADLVGPVGRDESHGDVNPVVSIRRMPGLSHGARSAQFCGKSVST